MITRISSVIRPKGSDLIFDHPYADSAFENPSGAIGIYSAHICHSGAQPTCQRVATRLGKG